MNLIEEGKIKNNNSKLKKFAFKQINIIIKSILFLKLIYKIESKINLHKIFIFNNTEIILKINKIGMQKILDLGEENFGTNYIDCPDEIYLNNEIQHLSSCSEINITKSESLVKLIWYEPLEWIYNLFNDCENIIEINFISLDYRLSSGKEGIDYMFFKCYNLEYINFGNFTYSRYSGPDWGVIFESIATNAVICVDQNKAPYIYERANNSECRTISCDSNWRNFQKKIDIDNNHCYADCNLTANKFEYEGKCYGTCPENTINYNYKCYTIEEETYHLISKSSSFPEDCPEERYLKDEKCICKHDYPFEIIETRECVNYCTISERLSQKCVINYESTEKESIEFEEKAIENVKEELTNGYNTAEIDDGKDVIINQEYSTITISTTENQKNDQSPNTTIINLGKCENKLKQVYNISNNKSLYILKIDVKQPGYQIPKIIYEVYFPVLGNNLIKLNLTACEGIKIDLAIPIKITDNLDLYNASFLY